MTTDLRGFSHPAGLLRELTAWRLAKAERALASAQAALDEAQTRLSEVRKSIEATVAAMTARPQHDLREQTHALHANRVVHLLAERQRRETEQQRCAVERSERHQACVALRQRIQGLERVHEEALHAHAGEQSRRQWRAMDDQIVTRLQWRKTQHEQRAPALPEGREDHHAD